MEKQKDKKSEEVNKVEYEETKFDKEHGPVFLKQEDKTLFEMRGKSSFRNLQEIEDETKYANCMGVVSINEIIRPVYITDTLDNDLYIGKDVLVPPKKCKHKYSVKYQFADKDVIFGADSFAEAKKMAIKGSPDMNENKHTYCNNVEITEIK